MNRDWKPGDVAMVTAANRPTPYRAYWDVDALGRGLWREYDSPDSCLVSSATARPLVVIDPENSRSFAVEAAQRACSALDVMPGRVITPAIEAIQDVLREYADPTPHIEEPTGLGAVVEDADGMRWLRGHGDPGFYVWRDRSDVIGRRFSDLKNVVRVLSDGAPS